MVVAGFLTYNDRYDEENYEYDYSDSDTGDHHQDEEVGSSDDGDDNDGGDNNDYDDYNDDNDMMKMMMIV